MKNGKKQKKNKKIKKIKYKLRCTKCSSLNSIKVATSGDYSIYFNVNIIYNIPLLGNTPTRVSVITNTHTITNNTNPPIIYPSPEIIEIPYFPHKNEYVGLPINGITRISFDDVDSKMFIDRNRTITGFQTKFSPYYNYRNPDDIIFEPWEFIDLFKIESRLFVAKEVGSDFIATNFVNTNQRLVVESTEINNNTDFSLDGGNYICFIVSIYMIYNDSVYRNLTVFDNKNYVTNRFVIY
jgi:hypothetical protein